MAINQLKREIYKEIVAEDGGSLKEVREIVESALEFTKVEIQRGEFNTIAVPYFGKFRVKPARLKKMNHGILQRRKPQSGN